MMTQIASVDELVLDWLCVDLSFTLVDDGKPWAISHGLHVLCYVVMHGGFAPAARALNLAEIHAQQARGRTEKDLGARLINPHGRVISLDGTGKDFYRHAAGDDDRGGSGGEYRQGQTCRTQRHGEITASVPTAQLSLAPLLPQLALAYPKLRVTLHANGRFCRRIAGKASILRCETISHRCRIRARPAPRRIPG